MKKKLLLVCLMAMSMLVAACGGGEKKDAAKPAAPAAKAGSTTAAAGKPIGDQKFDYIFGHGAAENGPYQGGHRRRPHGHHAPSERSSRLDRPLPDVCERGQDCRSRGCQGQSPHPLPRRQGGEGVRAVQPHCFNT